MTAKRGDNGKEMGEKERFIVSQDKENGPTGRKCYRTHSDTAQPSNLLKSLDRRNASSSQFPRTQHESLDVHKCRVSVCAHRDRAVRRKVSFHAWTQK